jgi:hypothetical protein
MADPVRSRCTREELLALQAELGSDRSVAARVGVSEGGVRYWRKLYGLPPHRPARVPLKDKMLALSLARQGATRTEAAARMGRKPWTVTRMLADACRIRGCARARFAVPAPKLGRRTKQDVLAALAAAGSDSPVARAWGVSRQRVQLLRRRFGIPALIYERRSRRKREAARIRAQRERDLLTRQLLTVHTHGATTAQAARRFRLPRPAVRRLLRHARISGMAPRLSSMRHEITDAVILALFDANPGASDMQAARLAGVTLTTMQRRRPRLGIATALARRRARGLPLRSRHPASVHTGPDRG